MAEKSVIIIGGGIAGLATGCYCRMNGYETRIFEMHSLPGGVCTAWRRGDYTIDGCLHWLTGTVPGSPFFRLWEELGVIQSLQFVNHEEYARIVGTSGSSLVIYSDVDRLQQHMEELAPEDCGLIEKFARGVRSSRHFPIPWEKPSELWRPKDGFRLASQMLPLTSFLKRWGKLTIGEYAKRFTNPFLREVFPLIPNLQHPPGYPMLALLMTLAWADQGAAGYPIGGSLELARTIERRFLNMEGKIQYGARVARILVKGDRAIGIRLDDGTEHRGDVVVSAADGHATIFDLLDGEYVDRKIRGYYSELPLFPPLVYIGLGVNRSFQGFPSTITGASYPLDKPIAIDRRERHRIDVQMYAFDPSLAPEGKTTVRVMYASDFDYWEKLHQDIKAYRAEKERILDQVVGALDRRLPGLADAVEVQDVATPMTWARYTGNWRGSFEGWMISTDSLRMRMKRTLPGLRNFYMAGQWVMPGGSVPSAAVSGRHAAQLICHLDRKPFTTQMP